MSRPLTALGVGLTIVALAMLVAGITPWCLLVAFVGFVCVFTDHVSLRREMRRRGGS
jgi:hypothetical protein